MLRLHSICIAVFPGFRIPFWTRLLLLRPVASLSFSVTSVHTPLCTPHPLPQSLEFYNIFILLSQTGANGMCGQDFRLHHRRTGRISMGPMHQLPQSCQGGTTAAAAAVSPPTSLTPSLSHTHTHTHTTHTYT